MVRCRAHARVRNLETEIARLDVATGGGLDAAALVEGFEPGWDLAPPDGTALDPVPDEVLATYRLATTQVDLTDAQVDETRAVRDVAVDRRPDLRELEREHRGVDPRLGGAQPRVHVPQGTAIRNIPGRIGLRLELLGPRRHSSASEPSTQASAAMTSASACSTRSWEAAPVFTISE